MASELKRKLLAARWREAANFVMPFGEFKGLTLEAIAETDRGLQYLDWLIGWEKLWDSTKEIIERFLADPTVKADLQESLRGDDHYDFGESDWEHWKD